MADIYSGIQRAVAMLDERRSALDAAQLMSEKHIGSVVVTSSSRVKGIFTERDLMRSIAGKRAPATTSLAELIPANIISVGPHENVGRCLALMREHRCRHLLVYEGDEFVGIVSLRDMVALMLEEKERLIQELTRYIAGAPGG